MKEVQGSQLLIDGPQRVKVQKAWGKVEVMAHM